MLQPTNVNLSGERFQVWYRIQGDESIVIEKAKALCIEQTVEFPFELLPPGDIPNQIVGQIASYEAVASDLFEVEITYPLEITGFELTQFLNILFGNSSLKPGIRVQRFELPESFSAAFRGPRFGVGGLRECLQIPERPILCTALKPMGLSAADLGELCYQFALGGIDIIKDDHGLANQPFCTLQDRIRACVEGVTRANSETGFSSVYMPNVTGPADQVHDNALLAKEMGAGALLIAPGLSGFDAMRMLADDDRLALPIMSHPAFIGGFVSSPNSGISHYALFGQINRLAGADVVVFPNFGGRFSFSKNECREIAAGAYVSMGDIKPIFPAPGGGMTLDSIPEMDAVYGSQVIYLVGGALYSQDRSLVENAKNFRHKVTSLQPERKTTLFS